MVTEAKIPSFRLRLWSNRSHIQLTPGAFEALGTTLSHAIQLLQSCGVNFKLTSCKGYSLLLHSNLLLASKPFYLIQHIKFYFILLFSKFQHLSLRLRLRRCFRLQVRILSIFFFSFITIIFFHLFIHDFAATVGGDFPYTRNVATNPEITYMLPLSKPHQSPQNAASNK